jgi:hypothetical protein
MVDIQADKKETKPQTVTDYDTIGRIELVAQNQKKKKKTPGLQSTSKLY